MTGDMGQMTRDTWCDVKISQKCQLFSSNPKF